MGNLCRKCLLKDMTDHEYYQTVYEYIKYIPEDLKTEESTYRQRLTICQSCESLVNGMCRICGCFVEIRAAKKINRCAKSEEIW